MKKHTHTVEVTFEMKVTTVAKDEVKDEGLDPSLLRSSAISFIANAVANGRTARPNFFDIDDVEFDVNQCLACKELENVHT